MHSFCHFQHISFDVVHQYKNTLVPPPKIQTYTLHCNHNPMNVMAFCGTLESRFCPRREDNWGRPLHRQHPGEANRHSMLKAWRKRRNSHGVRAHGGEPLIDNNRYVKNTLTKSIHTNTAIKSHTFWILVRKNLFGPQSVAPLNLPQTPISISILYDTQ